MLVLASTASCWCVVCALWSQVVAEMQAQPWGGQVLPGYVDAVVAAATHPDVGAAHPDDAEQQGASHPTLLACSCSLSGLKYVMDAALWLSQDMLLGSNVGGPT